MANETSVFEQATRQKLRFETSKGSLTTEDLFDLPLTSTVGKVNLDDIARGLHKRLKDSEEVSFVDSPAKADTTAHLKLEVVKSVIGTLKVEREAAAEAKARSEKKQKLLGLIAQKQDEKLSGASLEELQKELESL